MKTLFVEYLERGIHEDTQIIRTLINKKYNGIQVKQLQANCKLDSVMEPTFLYHMCTNCQTKIYMFVKNIVESLDF